jgi:phosphoribosylglycinamide formyltransferase-1
MKIGIIGSAGGSTFQEMARILGNEAGVQFLVLTDRECGLERVCQSAKIPQKRVPFKSNVQFSEACRAELDAFGEVTAVLLYYSRLVTEELFSRYPTFNIHPALLPAFPGIGAIRQAKASGVRYIGCTLHLVDASIDGGPIVGQVVMPIDPAQETEASLNKYSFLQKVYLSLVLIELLQSKRLIIHDPQRFSLARAIEMNDRCNPCLTNALWLEKVLSLQLMENVRVFPLGN